jgi:hypothetical protein
MFPLKHESRSLLHAVVSPVRGKVDRILDVRAGMQVESRCFAGAAAAILECPVLMGNPEFAVAERAGITVNWL